MTQQARLEVNEIRCLRGGKQIFVPVNFDLSGGQALLVEGPNGAGKSSLLRIIAGLATPAAGSVTWQNQSIHDHLLTYVEQLHYHGHQPGIRPGLSIAENWQLTSELLQSPLKDKDQVLQSLQLTAYENTQTQFLSAGQTRRAALAKLLLFPRRLWILDEPLTALDHAMQQTLAQHISHHLQGGGLCILSSHQPLHLDAEVKTLRLKTC